MKVLWFFAAICLGSGAANAGPNSDFLQSHTFETFITFEPLQKDRREIEITIKDGVLHWKTTCLFSELGLGSDAVVELESTVSNITEMSYTMDKGSQKSVTNDQGKVCAAFLDAGTKPYIILWGDREIVLGGRRVFKVRK